MSRVESALDAWIDTFRRYQKAQVDRFESPGRCQCGGKMGTGLVMVDIPGRPDGTRALPGELAGPNGRVEFVQGQKCVACGHTRT